MNSKIKLIILSLITIAATISVFILDPISQDPNFHSFVDKRRITGINNFWNVISNLPFLVIGIYGLMLVAKFRSEKYIAFIYSMLYIGILLTGIGSAYYHLSPNNDTLVWDRLPMTVVFMSFLCATISERINLKAGIKLLFPLIIIGITSVLWWHYTEQQGNGDLRLYILVQFYPMLFIVLTLLLYQSKVARRGVHPLVWVFFWYVLAKFFEHFDKPIYSGTGFVSGHSIKHICAAISTWYIVTMFRNKYLKHESEMIKI